jgi:aldose 1-epimerase
VGSQTSAASGAADGTVRDFGRLEDGRATRLHTLRADGIVVTVCDYGATLVSLDVPDRDGRMGGVVLGFVDVNGYETRTNNPFMGATVGRVANRIAGARFTLDGVEHVLHANEGTNHLHGGRQTSFDRVLWESSRSTCSASSSVTCRPTVTRATRGRSRSRPSTASDRPPCT